MHIATLMMFVCP